MGMSLLSARHTNSKRLSPGLLTKTQQAAVTALYEGDRLLVAALGGGKTVIAATALTELLTDKHITRALIITTPKIANTVWRQEFNKWEHTHHINIQAATGTPAERLKVFNSNAQIVVATFNVLPWIKKHKLFETFDGLLIDETTKLKTTGGAQFKALRYSLKKFTWRAGLTGTPVSEDFLGLYGQMFLIDCGKSLGTRRDTFLETYFFPTDYRQYNWELKEGAAKTLLEKISHLIHVVPDYRDTLPPITFKNISIETPATVLDYYDRMKKDMVTEDAISQTAAVLIQKLQQIACGFIYTESGEAKQLSDFRINELKKLLNEIDNNTLIAYWYQEDLKQLKRAIPHAEELNPKNLTEQVTRWNNNEIKHLLIHPRSAGHGLQLEQGGHNLVWYCPQWSNDLWEQTNARLWRKGQKSAVTVYTLVAQHTIDQLIVDRVENKAQFETIFLEHLKQ